MTNIWLGGYPVTITQLSQEDLVELQNHYLPHCLSISDKDRVLNGGSSFHKNYSQRWDDNNGSFFDKWNSTLEPYIKRYIDSFNFQFPWSMYIDTWYNVHGKYDFQSIHDHITTNCPAFSCSVVLKQPNDDAGQFCFHIPNFSRHLKYLELDPLNMYPDTYQPRMVDGVVIIFPSCLDHFVTQNSTEDLRVVFASNIVVKRTNNLF